MVRLNINLNVDMERFRAGMELARRSLEQILSNPEGGNENERHVEDHGDVRARQPGMGHGSTTDGGRGAGEVLSVDPGWVLRICADARRADDGGRVQPGSREHSADATAGRGIGQGEWLANNGWTFRASQPRQCVPGWWEADRRERLREFAEQQTFHEGVQELVQAQRHGTAGVLYWVANEGADISECTCLYPDTGRVCVHGETVGNCSRARWLTEDELHGLGEFDRDVALWRRELHEHMVADRAEEKANALLLEHLDEQQTRDWKNSHRFTVKAKSGRLYTIHRLGSQPVWCGDHQYCIQSIMQDIPAPDVCLARKLLIEADEERFLEIANDLTVYERASELTWYPPSTLEDAPNLRHELTRQLAAMDVIFVGDEANVINARHVMNNIYPSWAILLDNTVDSLKTHRDAVWELISPGVSYMPELSERPQGLTCLPVASCEFDQGTLLFTDNWGVVHPVHQERYIRISDSLITQWVDMSDEQIKTIIGNMLSVATGTSVMLRVRPGT